MTTAGYVRLTAALLACLPPLLASAQTVTHVQQCHIRRSLLRFYLCNVASTLTLHVPATLSTTMSASSCGIKLSRATVSKNAAGGSHAAPNQKSARQVSQQ